jgi:hypothetical protein
VYVPLRFQDGNAHAQRVEVTTLDDPGIDSLSPRHPLVAPIFASLGAGGLFWYLWRWSLGPFELVRVVVGFGALWLPVGWLVWLVTREEIEDPLSRFTFSAIASYAVTPLLYFALAVCGQWIPGLERLFPVVLAAIAVGLAIRLWRKGPAVRLPGRALFQRLDWVLVALVVASLCVVARYQVAFERTEDGASRLVTDGDQTYYASLVYELGRHVPPLQQPIRAGNPERAYHLLPHLGTMLLGRFTGQHDVLRAHLVYEYAWRVVLLCLATFSMVRTLTGSRAAGLMSVALLYVLAIPMAPWVPNSIGYFYFTGHPQATSGVEPVLFTSPQMFSGLVVAAGLLLGVLWVSQRFSRRLPLGATGIATAILVSSLMRFRAQVFIPAVSGFSLLLAFAWIRTRDRTVLAAAAVVVVLSGLLFVEMKSPVYLVDSASVVLGNNHLTFRPAFLWLNAWPFAREAWDTLQQASLPPAAGEWIWQGLSLSMFTFANVVGLPAFLGAAVFLFRPGAWREWGLFSGFATWLAAASVMGAMTLAVSYDPYSLGGQMPLHVGHYLLPLAVAGAWQGADLLLRRSRPRRVAGALLATAVPAAFLWQMARPPSTLEERVRQVNLTMSARESALLDQMREGLPADAVILSTHHLMGRYAAFSGLAGRRAYLEYGITPMDEFPQVAQDVRRRLDTIRSAWQTSSEPEFCDLLAGTPATHLVEYASEPLGTRSPRCLEALTVNPELVLWRVKR